MTPEEQREMMEAARKGESIRPELLEALRKMETVPPSRMPAIVWSIYLGILAGFIVYAIATQKPTKPWTKAEMDTMVREMAQEDARKELEQAADAYRRTLIQPSPSR